MQLRALTEKLAADVPGQQKRQSVNITKVEELFAVKKMLPALTKAVKQITGIARSCIAKLTDILA